MLLFAGQTVSNSTLVLVTLAMSHLKLTINTENIVLGGMMVKDIKNMLEK